MTLTSPPAGTFGASCVPGSKNGPSTRQAFGAVADADTGTGKGSWLSPGAGVHAWPAGQNPPERQPLTFHVGGDRQKQIFHGLIESFKLPEFLQLKQRQRGENETSV